jgi:hypothetical protein
MQRLRDMGEMNGIRNAPLGKDVARKPVQVVAAQPA